MLLGPFAARHELELRWTPIELLALSSFEAGLPYSPKKRAYVALDASRTAAYHGVPIAPPDPFPVQSTRALRLALVAQERGGFPAFHEAVFRAAWAERRDISRDDVLCDCVRMVAGSPDSAEWLARSDEPEIAERLSASTAEADARGVFGVPSVVVRGELFWGVDALPLLDWRLGGSPPRGD